VCGGQSHRRQHLAMVVRAHSMQTRYSRAQRRVEYESRRIWHAWSQARFRNHRYIDINNELDAHLGRVYLRRKKFFCSFCNSALHRLDLGLNVRSQRSSFLLHWRASVSSLVEWRKLRVGRELGRILGQVVIECDLEFSLFQPVVSTISQLICRRV